MSTSERLEIIERTLADIARTLEETKQQKYLTVEQVNASYGLSRSTLYRLRREGSLTGYQPTGNGKIYFDNEEIERLIASSKI